MKPSLDRTAFDRIDRKQAYLDQPNLAASFLALFPLEHNADYRLLIEELFYRLELGETSLDLAAFAQQHGLEEQALLSSLTNSGWLKAEESGLLVYQKPYLQFQSFYHQETTLACWIKHQSQPLGLPAEQEQQAKDFLAKLAFKPHQEEALFACLEQKMLLLAGLPGSGKSWFLSRFALLLAFFSYHSQQPTRLVLAAPTGKASHRLAELFNTAQQELFEQALFPAAFRDFLNAHNRRFRVDFLTLDKLLQTPLRPYYTLPTEPLGYDFVVVDECSMASTSQLYRLVSRLGPSTHLVLVGDPYQIPPVKGGNFFSQAFLTLQQKPQYQHLTLEFSANLRQEGAQQETPSQLVRLIRAMPKETLTPADFEASELQTSDSSLIWERDSKKIASWQKAWLGWAAEIAQTRQLEELRPKIESRAIVCFRADGDFGARTINQQILAGLRPLLGLKKIEPFHGMPFMIEKNDYSLGLKNGDRGVFFQEEGESKLRAFVFGAELEPDEPAQAFEIEEIGQFSPAYAFTVHKSQGSEYSSIWLLAAEEDSRLNQKNLLYTGLSRAKRQVSLLASEKALEKCLRNPIQTLESLDRFFR